MEPDFQKTGGLVPVITQDFETKEVLMLAYMDKEAWDATLSTNIAHYFSRSRKKLWKKGEESGNIQKVKEIRIDCDNDTILLLVEQVGGAACHKGYRSCFFRRLKRDNGKISQEICCEKIFDPKEVYK